MISYHNNCIDNSNQSNEEYAGGTEYMSVCGETGSGAECMQSEDVKFAMNVKELACKFIYQCKSKMSTLQNVQDAIDMCTSLCQMLFGNVFDDVKLLQTKCYIDTIQTYIPISGIS